VPDRADVVVVGGGLAALSAAASLAQAGVGVRVYDRGHFDGRPGGGIVSGTTLAPLGGPSVPMEAPYDRNVGERKWLFLTGEGDVTLDFLDAPSPMPSEGLHTVRHSTLAPWLAERAKTLGADLRPGAVVEGLQRDRRGAICGVRVAGADVDAQVTILADGGGLRPVPSARMEPPTVDVAESYWRLPAATVSSRLGGRPGYGNVLEILLGDLAPGQAAGGYLLPFRSGVAVGVVAPMGPGTAPNATQLLGRLEGHPSVEPFLRGGVRGPISHTELSDRPDIGRPLSGAGFLTAGTAAGLMAASGTRFLAVDAALRSGLLAANVARDAVGSHDASALELGSYRLLLGSDGLLGELRAARASGKRFRAAPGVARDIPRLMNALFHDLMTETGAPKRRIVETLRATRKSQRVTRRTLLRAGLVAGRWV
jgi:flavin-dependent dehydrogenase